jgi:uncharacterized protein (TIGR02246 family)
MTHEDQAALEAIVAGLEKAWNSGDGTGYGSHFTEDADFVNIFGHHGKGRQAIAAAHDQIFSTVYKGSVNRLELTGTRMLAPNVALAHMRASLEVPAGPMAGRIEALPSAVLVRDQGGWKIAAFHNTRMQAPPFAIDYGQPR